MAGEGEVIACHNVKDWNEKLKAANKSKKLILIEFTAQWCPPCRFMAPIFVEYAKKFPNVVFFKVDVDELSTVANDFEVVAMPTFVFMKEGVVIDQVIGAAEVEMDRKFKKHTNVSAA